MPCLGCAMRPVMAKWYLLHVQPVQKCMNSPLILCYFSIHFKCV
jgi:hypothetical protein